MEEEQTRIKKIITTIDNEKTYSFDVDETITFYEFKKILAASSHLLKNCFKIYYQQHEYTNDYNDNTLHELFPGIDLIPLIIISNRDLYDVEDELINLRFDFNYPCTIHTGKFKMIYCFSCNKSICIDCFNNEHKEHSVEDKTNYLAPAQLLMNNIFQNSSIYKADYRNSKYMECVNFRAKLKLNIFNNIRKMINDLEKKFDSCLEYFCFIEKMTENNTNENLELLKNYCIECFIKLKNEINTKCIIIDDEIFLTLYRKLKDIKQYKINFFESNLIKYNELNNQIETFLLQLEKISEELKLFLNNLLNKDLFKNFKNIVKDNIVDKIKKETIKDFIFNNIGVQGKSFNEISLSNVSSHENEIKTEFSSIDIIDKDIKKPNKNNILSYKKNHKYIDDSLGKSFFSNSHNPYFFKIDYPIYNLDNFPNSINSSKVKENNIFQKGLINTTCNNNTFLSKGFETNVHNNIFEEKFIDVLTSKNEKKEIETNSDLECNIEIVNNEAFTIMKEIFSEEEDKRSFVTMFPIYDTNWLFVACSDDLSLRIRIDFYKTFGLKDIQLKSFPRGGAFCNNGRYLYFTGGLERKEIISKIFLRIVRDNDNNIEVKMEKKPFMLYSHFNHSMVSKGEKIFVIGGYNTNKCESFNLRTSKWESMPDLNSPERQKATLVIYGDYLYAFMGHTQLEVLDSVERINIKTLSNNNWEVVNYLNLFNINTKFYGAGMYIIKEQVFFIGGKTGLGTYNQDYMSQILSYKFNTKELFNTQIIYNYKNTFIENEFHYIFDDIIGNYNHVNYGNYITIALSSLLK